MKMNSQSSLRTVVIISAVIVNAYTNRSPAQTQSDTLVLTLQQCIRMGQENGPLATMAREAYQNKKYHYKAFSASFYPQLDIVGNAPQFLRSINSITQPDGSNTYLLQRQTESTLDLRVSQQIPWTGTLISMSSGLERLDNLESKALYYRSTPLSFSLRQNLFSINTSAWNSESEALAYQSSHRQFVEAMEDAAGDITNKFFSFYLASMNVKNAEANLAVNDTLYNISKGRFNVGKIAENDLLQGELALLNAKTDYENAVIEYQRSLRNLQNAVGLPSSTPLRVEPSPSVPVIDVSEEKAIQYAHTNRSDIINFKLQELNAERNVRQAKSDNSFSMAISANVGLNQSASHLDDAYLNLLDQQQFSVQVQIPIFGFGSGSNAVQAAEADRARVKTSVESQEFSFNQDVRYQVQLFNQLQVQVALSAKADTVAQRRFVVSHERFIIGKIDVPNLFLAQSEKDNAYKARIQTLWNYWTTYYKIRRLTLYDFKNDRPLLQPEE